MRPGYCGASFSLRGALAPPVLPVSNCAVMDQASLRGASSAPQRETRAKLRSNWHGGAKAPRKLKLAPQRGFDEAGAF